MIGTSYYGNPNLKELSDLGIKLVSISRSTPSHINCIHYDALKPSWELINHWKQYHDQKFYRRAYNERLDKLDPSVIYMDLNSTIILCYEKPSDFCHRHLVAEWLRKHDYKIEEI